MDSKYSAFFSGSWVSLILGGSGLRAVSATAKPVNWGKFEAHKCGGFTARLDDRLVHNAHRLALKGESLRKAVAKRQTLDDKPAN